jgi:hypothetical protein
MITAHACYLDLAVDPAARQQACRKLFHDLIDEELLTGIRKNTNACGVIGDSRFKEQIKAMLGRTAPTGKRGRPGLVQ